MKDSTNMKNKYDMIARADRIEFIELIIITLATLIIISLFAFISQSYHYKELMKKIYSYDTIVMNNEEWKTSDVKEVTFSGSRYDIQYIFILKDGTRIACSGYTLKNQ